MENSDLLKNLVISNLQGYVFYFKDRKEENIICKGNNSASSDICLNENSNFRLASVTKQFIAYAVYYLSEKGLISLNDKLTTYICCLPPFCSKITIEMLLSHSSGILDYEDMAHTDEQIKDNDVYAFLENTKSTYFPIGSQYRYSNTAFVMLGILIEKVTKINLGAFLKQIIFDPLSMDNTVLNYQGKTIINNRVYGTKERNHALKEADQYWCSATCGDGGIYSNIVDLKKWIKFLRSLEIDHPMFKTHIYEGINSNYGLGIRHEVYNGYNIIWHAGDTIGFGTCIGFIEELDIEFIFLSNYDETDGSILIDNIKEYINEL